MSRVVVLALSVELALGLLPHLRLRRLSLLTVPWFFASWLTLELPLHHAACSALLIAVGAYTSVPWWGLLLGAVALGLHVGHYVRAKKVASVLVDALSPVLSDASRARLVNQVAQLRTAFVWPFPFRPRGVQVSRNVAYGSHRSRHRLDIYRSKEVDSTEPKRPVLVQVHGGGWTIGRKWQQGRPLMHALAKEGWVAVAINYRLSPWVKFPDHLVDVKRALAWVKEHIAAYGGDPSRIVITGGSAGAHLAALAALTANEPEFQPGFEDVDTSVIACVPFYGVYDFTNRHGDRGDRTIHWLLRVVLGATFEEAPALWEKASPLSWVSKDAPPFFVIHGTDDCLAWVEEGRRFATELGKVSARSVVMAEVPHGQHAFDVFHSVRTEVVVAAVASFVNEVVNVAGLRGSGVSVESDSKSQLSTGTAAS